MATNAILHVRELGKAMRALSRALWRETATSFGHSTESCKRKGRISTERDTDTGLTTRCVTENRRTNADVFQWPPTRLLTTIKPQLRSGHGPGTDITLGVKYERERSDGQKNLQSSSEC